MDTIEDRHQLLRRNRERIEFVYEKALADRMDDPVVFLLHLNDPRAGWLAPLTGWTREKIECWHQQHGRDAGAILLQAAPRWAVLRVIGPMTPRSSQGILRPNPPDTFRVVAIALGGNTFANFPTPPRARLEQERNQPCR